MKWSVQQLEKLTNTPYKFEFTLDFKEEIKKVEDILGINDVLVKGEMIKVNYGTYRLTYKMHVPLILQCALTLDPVEYLIETEYDEVHSVENIDEYFLIENNTLDMKSIIWTNILMEKPLSVTLPNAYEILKERGIEIIEDDEVFKEE